jgi:hypothetical protein
MSNATAQYISNTTSNPSATFGKGALLYSVIVGTAAASAVITIYNGTSSSGQVLGVIDASAVGNYNYWDMRCPNGLFVLQTGGSALVTVVAE